MTSELIASMDFPHLLIHTMEKVHKTNEFTSPTTLPSQKVGELWRYCSFKFFDIEAEATARVHIVVHYTNACPNAFLSTTVTIQNMYTYHCHNTKHVHVPVSQYKTCTHTTVTT